MLDQSFAPRPVPAWLAGCAAEVELRPTEDWLADVHPDDLAELVQRVTEVVAVAGSSTTMDLRLVRGGTWRHWHLHALNLVEREDVGGIVVLLRAIDGPPIEPPADDDTGSVHPTDWMIVYYDGDEPIVAKVEGSCEALLGYTPEEMIGRSIVGFMAPGSIATAAKAWLRYHDDPGATATTQRAWVRRDGTEIWLESSLLNRRRADGSGDFMMFIWDITARRQQEAALRQSHAEISALADEARRQAEEASALAAELALLADRVPAAVFRCEADGVVTFHNRHWRDLFGAGGGSLFDVVDPAAHDQLRAELTRVLAGTGPSPGDEVTFEVPGADGSSVLAVRLGVGDAERGRVLGSIDDITTTVRLRSQARHDTLTGLLNRTGLEEHLAEALTSRPDETLVVFIDLDGFKAVNDSLGHAAGDEVLVEVGRRLLGAVRPTDAVARFGGDEFVVVCHGEAVATDALVGRLELAISAPITVRDGTWQPRASFGDARPTPGADVASLLERADHAMFDAKRRRYAAGAGHRPALRLGGGPRP